MVERALIVVGFGLLVFAAVIVMRLITRRRVSEVAGNMVPQQVAARLPSSGPGLVYFYCPHCGTCRAQSGILDDLAEAEHVPVVRINAVEEPELARNLAVMSVPTTVVIDRARRVRAVNAGLRSYGALTAQLREAEALLAG